MPVLSAVPLALLRSDRNTYGASVTCYRSIIRQSQKKSQKSPSFKQFLTDRRHLWYVPIKDCTHMPERRVIDCMRNLSHRNEVVVTIKYIYRYI